MSGETLVTVVGNLVEDPDLRYTPSGAPVANFRIASTPRVYDRQAGQWKDGDTLFLSCSVWRQAAENVAESLTRGMRIIVQGQLKSRSYETRDGEKRTAFEIDVHEVGPSLRNATVAVSKASRLTAPQAAQPAPTRETAPADPWAAPAPQDTQDTQNTQNTQNSQEAPGSWGP